MTLEQIILEKVRALPPEQQQEILDFAEFLQVKAQQNLAATTVKSVETAQPQLAQDDTLKEATRSLGERLMAIRQEAIKKGMQPLTVEEVEQEIAEQRDRAEVRRQKALAAHQRIVDRSAEVEAKTGIQPSSRELIRQLREGEGRRD
jgi:hypothetical protein